MGREKKHISSLTFSERYEKKNEFFLYLVFLGKEKRVLIERKNKKKLLFIYFLIVAVSR